ncbi:Uncharacterised protein [Klebsiella pneumoniae]|nr:Uncharacterised protein [Klebsiella pneumoniae]
MLYTLYGAELVAGEPLSTVQSALACGITSCTRTTASTMSSI